MFYVKNLRTWESVSRVLGGALLAVAGWFLLPGGVWGWGVAATGAMLALTGAFGWCPMCAMVGRKL